MKWWSYVLAVFGFFAYMELRLNLEDYGKSIGALHTPWLLGFMGLIYGYSGPAVLVLFQMTREAALRLRKAFPFILLMLPIATATGEFLYSKSNFLRCVGLSYLDCAIGVFAFFMFLPAGMRYKERTERKLKAKGLLRG